MSTFQDPFELFGSEPDTLSSIVEAFEPGRLRQARVLARLKKSELANMIGVSAAAVGQFESGVTTPKAEHILPLARALEVEPGFFAAGRPLYPIDTGAAHFRSLRSVRAADRDQALATAEQAWELAHSLEKHIQFPEVNLPNLSDGTSPAVAARALRAHWNIPDGPFPHLVASMEANGIITLVLASGSIDRVDAFSTWIAEHPIVISTPRRSNNVFRHRFTCAHELGHLLLHQEAIPGDLTQEREADEFAAALLTPINEIRHVLPSRLDLAALARVGQNWGISIDSLIRRMQELGFISDSSVRRAYQRLNANPHLRSKEPWTAYRGETPSLLKQALEMYESSGLSLVDLAEELKWKPARIRELVGIHDPRPQLSIVK